jgi:pectinesterase
MQSRARSTTATVTVSLTSPTNFPFSALISLNRTNYDPVAGATDYIFGDASAWFGECTIASKAGGPITASSREVATDTAWYVFDHSTVTADTGVSLSQNVYLGRPWRVLARVIYQNSVLTGVVAPKGWTEMAENATP